MNDTIYTLLLKTAPGLTLFGTLRFRITSTQPLAATGADWPALLAQAEQQADIELTILPVEGSVSVPPLTGWRPTLLTGGAIFLPGGSALTLVFSDGAQVRQMFLQISEIDPERVAGALYWRPGNPEELLFSLLGTRQRLPA